MGGCLCGQLEGLPRCCQRPGGRCAGMAAQGLNIQGMALQEMMARREMGFQEMTL